MAKAKKVRKRRKGRGKAKGGRFEREMARTLSLWWTRGERDDIFWRSDSGARAKTRGKAGKKTFGQHGDIVLSDPCGGPFLELALVELKCGYNHASLGNLLDWNGRTNEDFFAWLSQTFESFRQSDCIGWFLITQRDRREPFIYMPWSLARLLKREGCFVSRPMPFVTAWFEHEGEEHHIAGMNFNTWMKCVRPKHVIRIVERERPKRGFFQTGIMPKKKVLVF